MKVQENIKLVNIYYFLSLILVSVISLGYMLVHGNFNLLLLIANLSNSIFILLLPFIVSIAIAHFRFSIKTIKWVSVTFVFVAVLLLFIDMAIYRLYQIHFSGIIWNLFITGGLTDSVHISIMNYIVLLIALVVLYMIIYALFIIAKFSSDKLWLVSDKALVINKPTFGISNTCR